MAPLNSHLTVEEVQEDRIQRVEQTVSQVSTQLAEQGIKVGYMSQQIADTKRDLTEKMDNLAADLTAKLDATCSRIDKVTDKVEEQDERLDELEATNETSAKRWALAKTIAAFILTGIGSVILAKVGEALFQKFGG